MKLLAFSTELILNFLFSSSHLALKGTEDSGRLEICLKITLLVKQTEEMWKNTKINNFSLRGHRRNILLFGIFFSWIYNNNQRPEKKCIIPFCRSLKIYFHAINKALSLNFASL